MMSEEGKRVKVVDDTMITIPPSIPPVRVSIVSVVEEETKIIEKGVEGMDRVVCPLVRSTFTGLKTGMRTCEGEL